MLILIKAYNRKKVIHPGIKGGKYWIDKQGNVRYGIKGVFNPDSMKKGIELFLKNIKYYTGMAHNIAIKAGINPDYYEGQPVGDLADILAAGRLAAIKAYDNYQQNKPKSIDLGQMMRKRIPGAMWSMAIKLKSPVNRSYHDNRNLKIINEFKNKYFARYGYHPDNNTILENIRDKVTLPRNKDITDKKLNGLITRLESNIAVNRGIEDLIAESENREITLPNLEQLMKPIVLLKNVGKITDIGYKIIEMYLGIGKYKKPRGWKEIGDKLNLNQKTIYWHFRKNADVIKPYLEKYRALLEKSITENRIREFIKEILEIKNNLDSK